jgi:hypothetical protein
VGFSFSELGSLSYCSSLVQVPTIKGSSRTLLFYRIFNWQIRSLLVGVQFIHVLSDINEKRKTRTSSRDHEAEGKVSPSFSEIIQFLASSHTSVKSPSTTEPTNFLMVENILITLRITQDVFKLGMINSFWHTEINELWNQYNNIHHFEGFHSQIFLMHQAMTYY